MMKKEKKGHEEKKQSNQERRTGTLSLSLGSSSFFPPLSLSLKSQKKQ